MPSPQPAKNASAKKTRTLAQPDAAPYFSAAALKFLRGLQRNNDRAWFEERRPVYESALRQPMLSLIAAVNAQLSTFAPGHVKAPEKTVLRIYRDTRFSKNKLPYKQNYGAWWGRAGMVKTSGAGFYFHVTGKTVLIAAGLYMPDAAQLLAVRRYLLEHHEELRRLLKGAIASRRLPVRLQMSDPLALTRAPKGFPRDHPALDLVLNRNWAVEAELAPEAALEQQLALTLAGYFRAAAPVVEFLNRPLMTRERARPLFAFPAS